MTPVRHFPAHSPILHFCACDHFCMVRSIDGEDEMKPTRIGLSATGREGARRPSGGGAGGRSVNAARRPAFRRQRSSRSDSGTPTPRRRKQLSPVRAQPPTLAVFAATFKNRLDIACVGSLRMSSSCCWTRTGAFEIQIRSCRPRQPHPASFAHFVHLLLILCWPCR